MTSSTATLSPAHAHALLVLLEAPSKQSVDAFFCSCFAERDTAGSPDSARVAAVVEMLSLSDPEKAAPLQRAALVLIRLVLYSGASPEQTAAFFPAEFHSSLQALITKVLQFHKDEWRAESLAAGGVTTMPRLESTSWQVYRRPTPSEHIGHPALLLGLQVRDAPGGTASKTGSGGGSGRGRGSGAGGGGAGGQRTVEVEMTKEQLNSMLDGLSKIKEQLAMVSES